ncbi:tyrosine-protein phosphatase non-receptor type 23 [Drosophila tropicalis]|uniref:tyrosine-protein phosphatase non-receptor type 23 n=1 Tax=Drosophila tropicalis TaxID=46794 RepID=UPI0035ABAE40
MWLRILFIAAAAFLIGLCRADVSEIKAPKDDVSVPFNDLLPPLLADSTTAAVEAPTSTTTTGKPQTTTLITKPTKKSYYQQQQTQLSKEEKLKSGTNKQQIQLLSLDLLPPFEDTSNKEDIPEAKPTTSRPIPKSQPQHVAKVQPSVAKVQPFVDRVQPKPQTQPQHQVQAVPKPQPHVARPQISRSASITPTSNPSALRQHLPSSPFFSAQFSNYFQSSTPRPRRGPLPTLTPFPRHIK